VHGASWEANHVETVDQERHVAVFAAGQRLVHGRKSSTCSNRSSAFVLRDWVDALTETKMSYVPQTCRKPDSTLRSKGPLWDNRRRTGATRSPGRLQKLDRALLHQGETEGALAAYRKATKGLALAEWLAAVLKDPDLDSLRAAEELADRSFTERREGLEFWARVERLLRE